MFAPVFSLCPSGLLQQLIRRLCSQSATPDDRAGATSSTDLMVAPSYGHVAPHIYYWYRDTEIVDLLSHIPADGGAATRESPFIQAADNAPGHPAQ